MIKKIVVADDERGSALLLSRQLEKQGFEVHVAVNGIEALQSIEIHKPDLLITDVVMPEMDGVDLYTALRENPLTENLPVIMVTDKEAFQESFASLGVELFSPKPFNFQDLLGKINKVEEGAENRRRYNKLVLISQDLALLKRMRRLLEEKDCIVVEVSSIVEIGLRCFLANPRVIVMDLFALDIATTKEVIRSLRAYNFFRKTAIVIYSNVTQEQVAKGALGNINSDVKECLDAGANKYIGSFNSLTFLENLKEFGL
jgi:CheY-like chemotaxis protein